MKIVIFSLFDKEYGVGIEQVKQVIRMRKITPVPEAAGFVEGVIALRGKVVPLVSLRKKLGIEAGELSSRNRIIITEIKARLLGVVVDAVTDVMTIEEGSLSPPDEMLKEAGYLIGVARIGKRLILIVDMEGLLGSDLSARLEKIGERVEVRRKNG